MTTKLCPGKGKPAHIEPVAGFTLNKSRPDGLAPYCKLCAAAIQREWKANNKAKVLASKRKYRLQEKES